MMYQLMLVYSVTSC